MQMRYGVITIAVIVFLWVPAVWGKIYIDIDAPAFQQFPVAVQDFKNLNDHEGTKGLTSWFADEMGDVLAITGFFRVIARGAFLEDARSAGITVRGTNFGDWLTVGSDFLIKGGYSYDGTQLSVEVRLFDVVEGKLITGKRYWGALEDRRTIVIKFAEEVLLALTGERGVYNTKIAFVGRKGKVSDIYTVRFDGTGLTRITDYQSLTLIPRWSPDGGRLSLTSYIHLNPDAYILDLKSGARSILSNYQGLNMAASWYPDGTKVLLTLSKDGNEEVYVMDLATKRLQRLTYDPAIDVSPCWSPDGSKIAFVSNRSGSPQIFIMDSDGKNVRRLTFEGSYNTSPAWSPTGGKIAYEGSVNGRFQLFVIDEDGSAFVQLTFEERGCEAPSWSPDGRYLTFITERGGMKKLCIINSNGLNLRVIDGAAKLDSLKNPAWSPRLDLY